MRFFTYPLLVHRKWIEAVISGKENSLRWSLWDREPRGIDQNARSNSGALTLNIFFLIHVYLIVPFL